MPHHPGHQALDAPPLRHQAVIGHIKAARRMGRSYLAGQQGDVVNAFSAAAGCNLTIYSTGSGSSALWPLVAAMQGPPMELETQSFSLFKAGPFPDVERSLRTVRIYALRR